ncbi:flagellar hook-basal body complex protein [Microbulbifer sp. TYP-18]|uniref:flagellar hook-basal body complex protein n=1 Tax=Microbulbifer sp. TYP-18 TaxID=3230024 RepID=UPI0034C62F5C
MSLLNVVSNSLSGFKAFTTSLDNLSHNVANMNSPGFKKQDSFFRELNDSQGGNGVRYSGSIINFEQGDIYTTGQGTNIAIEGKGFFIVENNGQLYYTRAGQFEIKDNKLVDAGSGGIVKALSEPGELVDIDISGWQVSQPEVTTFVDLSGNLSSLSAIGSQFPSDGESPVQFDIYDQRGEQHTLNIVYTKEPTGDWKAEVRNSDNDLVGGGILRFTSAGSPMADFSSFSFEIEHQDGITQTITANAGNPGEFTGLTSFPSQTNGISANSRDGKSLGALISTAFDDQGNLVLTYSNGSTETPFSIALAYFKDTGNLLAFTDSLFQSSTSPEILATADEEIVGNIRVQSLERSNVDITEEFSSIIIIQRGYQACSQVLSVSNEMLEELYNSSKGG